MKNFQHIPCGLPVPLDNPHAVSVSLPSISDVIGYEEQDPAITGRMKSGYPRFFQNLLVQRTIKYLKKEREISEEQELIPVASDRSVAAIEKQTGRKISATDEKGLSFLTVRKDSEALAEIKSLLQHSGMVLSSRKAEDFLIGEGIIKDKFYEKKEQEDKSEEIIRNILSKGYGSTEPEDIILGASGCNAFYSVFTAIKEKLAGSRHNTFVQLGWLYLDTMEIIRKYSDNSFRIINITDTEALDAYIKENHAEVACVITEVPNNPLVQTPDLPRLKEILSAYGIPLLTDSTIATPYNLEIMEYADIAVESLTKYACGNADVMMGAVVLNSKSEFAMEIKRDIEQIIEPPYVRDMSRLAAEIRAYQERVKIISDNTHLLAGYFGSSKKIKKMHWAMSEPAAGNYSKIMKTENSVPGLISVVFDKELQYYYDRLPVCKGPSFGTEFTLAMPYIYMAHYKLLKTPEGRSDLTGLGLDPGLLRISVGTEPADEIIRAFESV